MRIGTWNVEWFDALFGAGDALLLDDAPSGRQDVSRRTQGEAIARVLRAIDPDILLVVEAPDTGRSRSTIRALEGFAAHFGLRQSEAVIGFRNDTHQELAFLFDPGVATLRHDPKGAFSDGTTQVTGAPRFNGRFRRDVDADGRSDLHAFSKPPVEVEALIAPGGAILRLIGVHTKSKYPHGARSHEEAMRIALENRRKQLTECVWLRLRIDEHLAAGDDLVVLGDLNDGPGLDGFEALFGKSGVEIVLGDREGPGSRLVDPHAEALTLPRRGIAPTTARFYDPERRMYLNALLDYAMLSPALAARARPVWRVWHPFDNPDCLDRPELREALLAASDHFPVTVDLRA
jgi:hypothetical protein